jgi:transmembrane sensor
MTNIVEFEARASFEQQAREWLIRLDGDEPLTATERAKLQEWMDRSPLHREELRRLAKFWNQANVLTELAVPLDREPQDRIANRRMPALAIAASILFVSIISGWWWLRHSDAAINGTYGTAVGQQQTLSLPDGSSIQLNTDSQVQVSYADTVRKIRLLRGEALFSVTPDPQRPFAVFAAQGMVRAVGTAFSVRLKGSEVNVTVTQGVVDVIDLGVPSGDSTRLQARQTTTFDSGSAVRSLAIEELSASELQRRTAWHDGYLIFSGEPLSEVIREVNRYSPVTLELADPALASLAIGGRFRVGDLDGVLDVLHASFGIRSETIDDRRIRLQPERAP